MSFLQPLVFLFVVVDVQHTSSWGLYCGFRGEEFQIQINVWLK